MNLLKRVNEQIFRIFFKKNTRSEHNSVKKTSKDFLSSFLQQKIKIDIYLPPSYVDSKWTSFPVLFLNDGQEMKAVKLEKTLNELYAQNSIREVIVFAFYPVDRINEYGTNGIADYADRGNKSKDYQRFLVDEWLPKIQEEYPVSLKKKNYVIAGFSQGGLSAFDTAWNYSDFFGKVGVFSGSFWWRSKAFIQENPDADRIVHEYVKAYQGKLKELKFWLQTGTNDETDDRNNNGIIDSIDDTTDLIKILSEKGYSETVYREVLEGEHNPKTWGEVMPEFLEWAFGT